VIARPWSLGSTEAQPANYRREKMNLPMTSLPHAEKQEKQSKLSQNPRFRYALWRGGSGTARNQGRFSKRPCRRNPASHNFETVSIPSPGRLSRVSRESFHSSQCPLVTWRRL